MRKLYDTVFIKNVYYLLIKYNEDVIRESKGSEKYIIDTALALENVRHSEKKLKLSLKYIEFNKDIDLNDVDFTKKDLMEFTIEGFMVRNTSVFDRVLILINCILRLGLSRRHVNFSSVMREIVKSHSDLLDSLKDLEKITSKYRHDRNRIIHESAYADIDLTRIQITSDCIQKDLSRGMKPIFDLDELNIDSNLYLDKKLQEFYEHVLNVESAITNITNILDSEFTKNLTCLSRNEHNK